MGGSKPGPVPNVPTPGWLTWSLGEEQSGAVGIVSGGRELVWPGGQEVTRIEDNAANFIIVMSLKGQFSIKTSRSQFDGPRAVINLHLVLLL